MLDALVAALLVEPDPVEIRSESPATGEAVVITVTEDEITVTPDSAVFSVGIAGDADSVESLDDGDSVARTTCQYIDAFPDETAFREWQDQVSDVVVMQLDVDTMATLTRRAADDLIPTTES